MQLQSEVAGTGASEGQLDISLSGFLDAVCGSGRLGLLVAWHLQGSGSSPTVAQGSSKSVLVKRADMEFYDWIFQVVLCLPFATGWNSHKSPLTFKERIRFCLLMRSVAIFGKCDWSHPSTTAQYTEVFGEMGRHCPLTQLRNSSASVEPGHVCLHSPEGLSQLYSAVFASELWSNRLWNTALYFTNHSAKYSTLYLYSCCTGLCVSLPRNRNPALWILVLPPTPTTTVVLRSTLALHGQLLNEEMNECMRIKKKKA